MANRLVSTVTAAASTAVAITPNDNNDLPNNTRALWIGGAGTGTLTVNMAGDGAQVAFAGIPAGTLLPIQVSRVFSTGTGVTSIVGLN